MFGITIDGPEYVFCDNKYAMNNMAYCSKWRTRGTMKYVITEYLRHRSHISLELVGSKVSITSLI